MRLNKWQLDCLCTISGLIAGISLGLTIYQQILGEIGGIIGAIAITVLGYLSQRPADARPITEQVEEVEVCG